MDRELPEQFKAFTLLPNKYAPSINRAVLPIQYPQIDLQSATPNQLMNHLQELKRLEKAKNSQLSRLEGNLKIQKISYQSYQFKLQMAANGMERQRMRWARWFIQHYKDYEENPIFHNPNGLSPMEMQLMRYETSPANNQLVCMICFAGFEQGSYTIRLPCTHLLHSECGMTRLLYTRECPACNEVINIEALVNK